MANALGYNSPQFISNFERGISLLPTMQLLKYADKLNLAKDELYKLLIDEQRQSLRKLFKNPKI